jgi:hypothetical protein
MCQTVYALIAGVGFPDTAGFIHKCLGSLTKNPARWPGFVGRTRVEPLCRAYLHLPSMASEPFMESMRFVISQPFEHHCARASDCAIMSMSTNSIVSALAPGILGGHWVEYVNSFEPSGICRGTTPEFNGKSAAIAGAETMSKIAIDLRIYRAVPAT